jgi:predicted  nucleic acid-binding Zn-ribbon protein
LTNREIEDLKQEILSKEKRADVLETKKIALENEITRFEKRSRRRHLELSQTKKRNRELTQQI